VRNDDLPNWRFEVDEVSAGVWHGRGTDRAGRSVEASGTDPEALLDKLKSWAGDIADDEPEYVRRRTPQA
jgi:hypothetical protein